MVEGAGLEIRCSALHYRGFESLSLRPRQIWRGVRVVEGARLEVVYGRKPSGVRIPPSPFSSRYLAMNAAQPRQGRNAAAVSGMFMRPGAFAAVSFLELPVFMKYKPHVILPFSSVTLSLLYLSSFRRCHNKI